MICDISYVQYDGIFDSEGTLFSEDDSMLSPGDISFAGDDFEVTSTFATTKLATTKLATTKLATTKTIANHVIDQNVEALNNILEGFGNVEESLQDILTILEDISNKTDVSSAEIQRCGYFPYLTFFHLILHHMI